MMQRKRFFSGDGPQDLPLLSSSATGNDNGIRSPPTSSNSFDLGRLVPGRTNSMSRVRQMAGDVLNPQRTSSSSTSTSKRMTSNIFPSHSDGNLSHVSYGMLNPGPNHYCRSSSCNNNQSWAWQVAATAGLVLLAVFGMSASNHNNLLRQELIYKETEVAMHTDHTHALERRVTQMRGETLHLYDKLDELEHPPQTQEEQIIERKVQHLEVYHDKINKGIQEDSRRILRERFGPGPNYYVEMKLEFDPESNIVQDATTDISDTVVFETASIDDMPHAVHLFLEQVEHGLYNGASFYRNTMTKIQAGFQQNPDLMAKLEAEPSLGSVLFQEYSPAMAHRQYTLGYPGRPGGPDFYVNMLDNTQLHGPGGQHHHTSDVMVDADPCFARVIRGFNTMERIHRSKVVDDEQLRHAKNVMVHPILIKSMRIKRQ